MARADEWISAREAFERASFSLKDDWKAMRRLRDLAKNCKVKSRGVVDGKMIMLRWDFWLSWELEDGSDASSRDDWINGRFLGALWNSNGIGTSDIFGASKVQFSKREIGQQFPDAAKRARRQRGRPQGGFWPAVAEELAVAAHDGVPDGPDRLINKVLDGMSEKGVDPLPDRTTIQATVGNVFDRITRS